MGGHRGRQRSEQSIEAEKLYHEGKKRDSGITLAEIAQHLQVPEATVRRWKSTQKWDDRTAVSDKKKLTERSENEKANVKKKANVRKKGSGAPKNNKNAMKLGLCTRLLYQTLTEEEKTALAEAAEEGVEAKLTEELGLIDIRIAVLEKKKRALMTADTLVSVVGQSRTEKTQEIDGEETGVVEKTTTTNTENKDLTIMKYDSVISQYLARKNKILDSLVHLHTDESRIELEVQKIELERQKLKQEESSNKSVDDWMASFEEEE